MPDVFDKIDIMNKLKCGETKAKAIIRSIKDYTGDVLKIRGKVLATEYEAWKNAVLMLSNKKYLLFS